RSTSHKRQMLSRNKKPLQKSKNSWNGPPPRALKIPRIVILTPSLVKKANASTFSELVCVLMDRWSKFTVRPLSTCLLCCPR
ncbi:hypothetical protein LB507_008248, partial [Fusarium sp. FIESC RH6]